MELETNTHGTSYVYVLGQVGQYSMGGSAPGVFISLQAAKDHMARRHNITEWSEITKDHMWRAFDKRGNWFIDKCPVYER